MPDYVAVVRRGATDASARLIFSAQDLRHAIKEMCRGVGVPDTPDLCEFELLEILSREGKGSYRCVATKSYSAAKMHCKVDNAPAVTSVLPPVAVKETAYQGYDIIDA